jgi:hypothetical protein
VGSACGHSTRRRTINDRIAALEAQLNDFDPTVRACALSELVALSDEGSVEFPPEGDAVNMHGHTFFSYNAYGHSPSSLAWLAKRRGFRVMGIVDFDVLDGVNEFLNACDAIGVRGAASMETRVFVPEFSTREINSPGEPGVFYHMGCGFTSCRVPDAVAGVLDDLRHRAKRRNESIAKRVNAYLDPVGVNYEEDVLPLTPAGTATERHMVTAYVTVAERTVSDVTAFWADKLSLQPDEAAGLMSDVPRFKNTIRAKLMKRGGVGYVQPTPDMFPTVEEVNRLTVAAEALPCATWLDGMSDGEQDIEELLSLLIGKGVVALNIIPDRNWNIADPHLRRLKVRKLHDVVRLAGALDLPLVVGTEMNRFGQKIVDDFDAPELEPVRAAFMAGAFFLYGHTVLQRTVGLGYQSAWAQASLPTRADRNEFYLKTGRRVPPGHRGVDLVRSLEARMTPADVLAAIEQ